MDAIVNAANAELRIGGGVEGGNRLSSCRCVDITGVHEESQNDSHSFSGSRADAREGGGGLLFLSSLRVHVSTCERHSTQHLAHLC